MNKTLESTLIAKPFHFRKHTRMSSREGEQTPGVVEETEAVEAPAEAENETDKVKPVIYIGLTLTLLLGLGIKY